MPAKILMKQRKESKYTVEILIKAFRRAAAFRNEMNELGFTDNGGAIHSAERILDILGQRLKYPSLSHSHKIRDYQNAEFSVDAWEAFSGGKKVFIEHVSPVRAFTQKVIKKLTEGITDEALQAFIKKHYRLVLLTADETVRLNKQNRTKMHRNRLQSAGIETIICNRTQC